MNKPSQILLLAVAAGLQIIPSAQAADVTWTASASGNWSAGTNWSTTPGAPANDGSDKILFSSGKILNTGVDAGSWAVSGLTFGSSSTAASGTVTIGAGALSSGAYQANQSSTLSIGAGGISILTYSGSDTWGYSEVLQIGSPSVSTNVLTVNTTADQTWKAASVKNGDSATQGDSGTILINANLTGNNVVTVRGNDDISSGATNRTTGLVNFASGNSTGFIGSFVLQSGQIQLTGTSQLNRLGSKALTIQNSNTQHANNNSKLTLANMNSASQEYSQALTFVDTGSSYVSFNVTSTAAAGSKLNLTGTWSGAINDGFYITSNNGDNLLMNLTADNSGLTSSKTVTANNTNGRQGSAHIWLQSGALLLGNANALGANNSLAVSLGSGGATTTVTTAYLSAVSSVYTNGGINVGSLFYVDTVGSTYLANVSSLGVINTGSSAFTGAITMRDAAGTDKGANLRLKAVTGGTANFSGNIADQVISNNILSSNLSIMGGGTVIMGGSNTYKGGTDIVQGTTLIANGGKSGGSATGYGSLNVGTASASVTGTTTLSRAYITVSSKAGLYVGQAITGAGIPAGTTITFISASSNYIEISQNATATGTNSLTAAAEIGILGGNGRIAPGLAATGSNSYLGGLNAGLQSIHVAAGSSIAPGNVGEIGALTLDGTATSVALLTMDAGAKFTFDLGTSNNSDQLIFWNFTAGDLALNNNEITLNNIQAGTFTLFKFFSNGGTTAVDNSLISGLVNGLTLAGYDVSSYDAALSTSGNEIILNVAAVPEPSTWAMLVGGMGLLALRMRRRMA